MAWTSRGLRGSTLEEMINRTNEQYRDKHLALIQKVPTPITPIKIDKESRHITLAYFEKKSFTARDEYYYLRYETMKTFWDRGQNGGKKHFSYTELETSFFLPRTGSSVLVPYLNGIQKDLEIRDSKAD